MRNGLAENLVALGLVFAPLSLLSFGGGTAVIADIAQQTITVHHWTSAREFADLFALSRAAPGPGSMVATMIGWRVAGLPGALTATLAYYLPSALLVYGAARVWGRWRGSPWHAAVERGLAPVAAGLFLAGGVAILRASPGGWPVWLAAGVTGVALLRWPRLHPVPLLLAGAALFGLLALL
jgi:chromate transporter